MVSRGHLLCGSALAVVACMEPAWASDQEEVLDDVVVSANRMQTPIKQVGSSITVLTAQEVEDSQSLFVSDVLSRIPGVVGMDYFAKGSGSFMSSSSLRGVSFSGVKVLVDGVQMQYLSSLIASDIERIEVLKGSQSTLYGSDAMGGVVSITTKSGQRSQKLIEGDAFSELGTQHTYKVGANFRGRYDAAYYNLGFTQYDTDGFNLSENSGDQSENDGYENFSFNARLGADLVKDVGIWDLVNLEYNTRYLESDMEFDDAPKTAPLKDSIYTAKTNPYHHQVRLKVDMLDGLLSNELSGAYSVERWTHARQGTTTGRGAERHTKYEYKGVLRPVDDHTFVFGADYEKVSGQSTPTTSGSLLRSQQGFYGNYQLEALDDSLTLTMGVRYDKADAIPGKLTYRSTIGYYLDDTGTRLHASYGTGFKLPSAKQVQGGYNNLDPESSRGYDFGVEQTFWEDRVVVDVTAFNTRIRDEVICTGMAPTGQYVYENLGSTRTYGVETSVSVEATPEINLTANYTNQLAKDLSNNTSLTLRPRHSGAFILDYAPEAVPGLATWLRSTYRSGVRDGSGYLKDYVGGFAVFDVGGSYEWDHGITFYGHINNLFDKTYELRTGYATSGIDGTVGMRLKF